MFRERAEVDVGSRSFRRRVRVNENSRIVAAAVVAGAVLGGIAGYLVFTDHGRSLRRQIEPALDDVVRELNSFRGTVQRAAAAASDGWKLLNDALGDGGSSPYAGTRQTSPF
jgi:hypothetical protein